jgi:hypothetical protein
MLLSHEQNEKKENNATIARCQDPRGEQKDTVIS